MDYLRSCYSTRVRPWVDSDAEAGIVWYRCAPGAVDLGHPTVYASLNWAEHRAPQPVGEITGAPRHYYRGANWLGLTGRGGYCGRLGAWRLGARIGVDAPLARRPDGVPVCCDGPLAMLGGGEGGGEALVSIAPMPEGGGEGGGEALALAWMEGEGGGEGGGEALALAWMEGEGGGEGGGEALALAWMEGEGGGEGGGEAARAAVQTSLCIAPLSVVWHGVLSGDQTCLCWEGVEFDAWWIGGLTWRGAAISSAPECGGTRSFIWRGTIGSGLIEVVLDGCMAGTQTAVQQWQCDPFRFVSFIGLGTDCGCPTQTNFFSIDFLEL